MSIASQPFTATAMGMSLQQMVDEISAALEEKLRVRGKSLEAQLRKAGRRLPRRVREDATYLRRCVALMENPKLAKMVDLAKAQKAHRNVMAHLTTVDLAKERADAALSMLGSIAFALLFTGVMVLVVLWARGFV